MAGTTACLFAGDGYTPPIPLEAGRLPLPGVLSEMNMAIDLKPGQTVRVTISKHIHRDAARKTLERLFLQDKAVSGPIAVRERNFKALPKRRGGRIWTKRPNKLHPTLDKGASATIKATPQSIRDLGSVEDFVEIQP
jgi:hypothetical protein